MNIITFNIRKPIWGGRKVGLAKWRVDRCDICEINLRYIENKSGDKMFPKPLRIKAHEARKYPTQTVHNNVVLYIIPIADLVETR